MDLKKVSVWLEDRHKNRFYTAMTKQDIQKKLPEICFACLMSLSRDKHPQCVYSCSLKRQSQFKGTIMCQSLNSHVPVTEPFSQQVCLPRPSSVARQAGQRRLSPSVGAGGGVGQVCQAIVFPALSRGGGGPDQLSGRYK